MHGQLQHAALTEAEALLDTCGALVELIQVRGLPAEVGLRAITVHLGRLLAAADQAFGEGAGLDEDLESFARHLRMTLSELAAAIDECPQLPEAETTLLAAVRRWLEARMDNVGDTADLEALAQSWAQRPPHVGGAATCLRAVDKILIAADLGVPQASLERMTIHGLHAFGPEVALTLARHYRAARVTNAVLWGAVEVALDELASWAAAPHRNEPPEGFRRRSVEVLLELAADETLSMWVVPRLPLHHLTSDDLARLGQVIQERDRPKEFHELGEDAELCTGSLETAYLWAVEARRGRWPGMAR